MFRFCIEESIPKEVTKDVSKNNSTSAPTKLGTRSCLCVKRHDNERLVGAAGIINAWIMIIIHDAIHYHMNSRFDVNSLVTVLKMFR